MRTKISLILVVSILIATFSIGVNAVDVFTISVENVQCNAETNEVTADIVFANNPGVLVAGFQLNYDDETFTYGGFETEGTVFEEKNLQVNGESTSGSVIILAENDENNNNNGVLATLKFDVNENAKTGEYAFELVITGDNRFGVYDENFAAVETEVVGETIHIEGIEVKPFTISVENVAYSAETDEVTADIVFANNPGVLVVGFQLNYDDETFTYNGFKTEGTVFPEDDLQVNGETTLGSIIISASAEENNTNNGTVATLNFNVNDNIETEEYAFELVITGDNRFGVYDENYAEVETEIVNGSILLNHKHNYSATVTEPTCDEGGHTTYTCACGESYIDDETEALGHDFEEVDRVDASCKGDGYIKYECTRCDEEKTELLSSVEYGHTQGDELARTEPTCTEKGSVTYKCSVCGEEITKEIAALGHDLKTETTAATCKDEGSAVTTCTRCDYIKTETLEKAPHTWGDWEVVEEATEDEEGLEQRICSVCGVKETRVIDKVDDNKWSYLVQSIRLHALRQQKANKDSVKVEVEEEIEEPVVIDEAIVEEAWVNPFVDIYESDSYYAAIEFVYENGLFKGVSEIEFAPATTMTRAMFVTVLGRLHGITEDYVGENTFADVVEGEWYAPYVVWAADNGIVLGYGDGTFGINDEITVEQAAVILARYTAFIELDVVAEYDLAADYADAADVSEWAAEAMTWAVAEGIYEGVEVGEEDYLFPQTPAARSLVATMLYNFAN